MIASRKKATLIHSAASHVRSFHAPPLHHHYTPFVHRHLIKKKRDTQFFSLSLPIFRPRRWDCDQNRSVAFRRRKRSVSGSSFFLPPLQSPLSKPCRQTRFLCSLAIANSIPVGRHLQDRRVLACLFASRGTSNHLFPFCALVVFTLILLVSRYIYKMYLSYTAFVWAIWIIIWTSPPVLTAILAFCTREKTKEDHYAAVYQSHSKDHRPRSSPDIRTTVNDTIYYTCHFYTVSQAFAFVNIGHALPISEWSVEGNIIRSIGWIVCLSGFAGLLWSRHNLGTEWRGAPEVRHDHKLVTTGPYKITRHPIYTSIFMMMFGSALTTLFWVGFLEFTIVVIAYSIKAVAEEKMLLVHFGKQYAEYQKSTAMLFPYIY